MAAFEDLVVVADRGQVFGDAARETAAGGCDPVGPGQLEFRRLVRSTSAQPVRETERFQNWRSGKFL
jgi:hypothetical protein